jgi:hydroxyethylthiazole kinase
MTKTETPGTLLTAMRGQSPLVQCITNYVAMNVAANVLLAAGASPAMVHAEEEAGEFAGFAGALTVNIGTLSPAWIAGMKAAVGGATAVHRPWVLDPVAHFATGFRRKATADLLALGPTVIRGNASEIMSLAGGTSRARGVDSRDPVERAEEAARSLAATQSCIVAVTGVTDFVTAGERAVRIHGGSSLMPQVTALGCSLTCLVGAYTATRPESPFDATVAALVHFAVAGKRAAERSQGPGSFAMHFIDQLAAVDAATLDEEGKVVRL